MAQLRTLRTGWQNEHFALFVLSKLAFVANPVTVSDDLGSDFFCTLFETRTRTGRTMVVPRNSFAIQIKSSATTIDASKNISYLRDLEIPFFAGVVNARALTLKIYSGEYVPLLFSRVGIPKRLRIRLVDRSVPYNQYYEKYGDKKYRILFPRIITIRAREGQRALRRATKQLHDLCARVQQNIASRRSDEHIYTVPPPKNLIIMAGRGSNKVFRENLNKRLAEVFYNLEWILRSKPRDFDIAEYQIYRQLFLGLRRNRTLPSYVTERYQSLRTLLKNKGRLITR